MLISPNSVPVEKMPPPQMSPAKLLADSLQWMTQGDHTPVVAVRPLDNEQVEVIVADSWSRDAGSGYDPEEIIEMDKMVADHANSIMKDSIDGVSLLVRTEAGYVGDNDTFPSGDEQYFATSIPGVTSQFLRVEYDVDGDGVVGEDESAYLFEVESEARTEQMKRVLNETYDNEPIVYETRG